MYGLEDDLQGAADEIADLKETLRLVKNTLSNPPISEHERTLLLYAVNKTLEEN